jgi:hypothetical protein
MKAFPRAHSLGGVQLRIARLPTGNVAASEAPNINRRITSDASTAALPAANILGAEPVRTVVHPHSAAATAKVTLAPMASPNLPGRHLKDRVSDQEAAEDLAHLHLAEQ